MSGLPYNNMNHHGTISPRNRNNNHERNKNSNHAARTRKGQIFQLHQTPCYPPKEKLSHSISLPSHPRYRPLPRTPGGDRQVLSKQNSEGGQVRKQLLRRKTAGSRAFQEAAEDHIYEEIPDEDSDSEERDMVEENSFLSLISYERRRNLKYYGCTDWDFGTKH